MLIAVWDQYRGPGGQNARFPRSSSWNGRDVKRVFDGWLKRPRVLRSRAELVGLRSHRHNSGRHCPVFPLHRLCRRCTRSCKSLPGPNQTVNRDRKARSWVEFPAFRDLRFWRNVSLRAHGLFALRVHDLWAEPRWTGMPAAR